MTMSFTGLHLRGWIYVYLALLYFFLPLSFALPITTRTTISCHPIVWEQILVFFLLNYGAHAATTISIPGAKWWANGQWQISAFFFPFAGLGRAIGLLIGHRLYGEDELGKAIAMGAVVVVGRSKNWQPRSRERGEGDLVYVQLPDGFNEATDLEMYMSVKFLFY
jgi:hypothetical protein